MPQPIDYMQGQGAQVAPKQFQNPLPRILEALNYGIMLKGVKDERDQKQAAAAAEAERQKAVAAAFDLVNADPSVQNYAALANMLPEKEANSVRANFAMLTEDKQRSTLAESVKVFTAFRSGNPEIALGFMKDKVEAYKNDGNEKAAKGTQMLIDLASKGPEGQASVMNLMGLNITLMPGGKDAMDSVNKYLAETRTAEEHPVKLEQLGADLGLTQAQINETLARTRKLDAETQQLALEMAAAQNQPGGMAADRKPEFELKLNKEYNLRIINYTESKGFADHITLFAGQDNAVADMSLIFNYMKLLDRRSVVRESEYLQAADTLGAWDSVSLAAARFKKGDKLTPTQRANFSHLTKLIMANAAEEEKRVRANLSFMVKNYGLNPENVFGTMANPASPTAQAPASPTAQAPASPNGEAGLRDFIKSQWPAEAAKIDKLTDAELIKAYPKTVAAFKPAAVPAAVPAGEVGDF